MGLTRTRTRTRTTTIGMVAAVIALLVLPAAPARAATCTSIPGSVPGTDVSVLGNEVRVATISDIEVCVDAASAPLLAVDTAGHGFCSTGCLSVLLRGGEADAGAVEVSFRADGELRSEEVDPDGAGGGFDACVFSVGSPDAPYPDCAVAVGPDGIPDLGPAPGEMIAEAERWWDDAASDAYLGAWRALGTVRDTVPSGLVRNAPGCQAVPDLEDPYGGYANFCADPFAWVMTAVDLVYYAYCVEGECNPVTIVCYLAANDPC